MATKKLSSMEQKIMEYLCKGMSNYQIAKEIKRSPHTISAHIRSIYVKMDVNCRAQAVYEFMLGNEKLQGAS